MSDLNSLSASTIADLTCLITEYEEKIKNGTSDPDHFMSMSEVEELLHKLNSDTRGEYTELTEKLLSQIDQKALVSAKK